MTMQPINQPRSDGSRRRIEVLALGGTISAALAGGADNEPRLSPAELLKQLPEADTLAEISITDVARIPSSAVTMQHVCELAARISAAFRDGVEGAVITQGTDLIDETSYALALMFEPSLPVVVTGAMRSSGDPGADGPANLLAAIQAASTPALGACGPIVVMQDEIHLARWVAKVHTARIGALASPGSGPIGEVVEGRVALWGQPVGSDYVASPDVVDGRVEIVPVVLGGDGFLVDAAAEAADAIVLAAAGGGHVPPAMVPAIERALGRGLPVLLASRVGSGRILRETYSGAGSETHLLSLGVRPVGALSPLKARARVMVAMAVGRRLDDVFPAPVEILPGEPPSTA